MREGEGLLFFLVREEEVALFFGGEEEKGVLWVGVVALGGGEVVLLFGWGGRGGVALGWGVGVCCFWGVCGALGRSGERRGGGGVCVWGGGGVDGGWAGWWWWWGGGRRGLGGGVGR